MKIQNWFTLKRSNQRQWGKRTRTHRRRVYLEHVPRYNIMRLYLLGDETLRRVNYSSRVQVKWSGGDDGIYCAIVIIVIHNNNRWRIGVLYVSRTVIIIYCVHTCCCSVFSATSIIGVTAYGVIRSTTDV